MRELRHAIERAILLSAPGTLDPAELVPASVTQAAADTGVASATMTQVERRTARDAVARCGGNKRAAARALGISRARLLRLLDDAGGAA